MASAAGNNSEEVSEDSDVEYLPEKPQEPLTSDCCGTGCTPCVMDLYQEEMERWSKLKTMSREERQQWWRRREQRREDNNVVPITPDMFKRFELIAIAQVTKDSFLYSFKLPENQSLGLKVGQHLIMRLHDNDNESVTRQYTPVSSSEQKGSFNVLIKIYDNGRMSHAIQHSLKLGDMVEWRGPFGEFHYQSNQFHELIMLACGTGIAPMVQVIRAVLCNEDDCTRLTLLYALRTQHDILLKTVLDEFCDYWNFKVIYYLSQCSKEMLERDKGQICYSDHVKFGRIGLVNLESEVADKIRMKVLVCGTKSFDKDMIKYLLLIGYTYEQIFKF